MNPGNVDPPADSPDSGSGPESTSASGAELTVRVRRRPVPRKGHTKSRRGCLNCKRRKVKCQETLPECAHCTRIGLVCEYPDRRPRPPPESPTLSVICSPLAPLQSTPVLFTGNDMRFFHHFLVTSYPPLPILGDDLWRDVAAMSHSVGALYLHTSLAMLTGSYQHDYLMHAMLGMAASHLTIYGGNFSSQALSHRVKAIHSLNQALSTPITSTAEGDARFAAMFALAFQASCMPEGMTEFLSMIKGCHIIATTSLLTHRDSLFWAFTQQGYGHSVRQVIGTAPLKLDPDQEALIDGFLESLHALAPLCRSALEVRFLASTERVANLAKISAAEGQSVVFLPSPPPTRPPPSTGLTPPTHPHSLLPILNPLRHRQQRLLRRIQPLHRPHPLLSPAPPHPLHAHRVRHRPHRPGHQRPPLRLPPEGMRRLDGALGCRAAGGV